MRRSTAIRHLEEMAQAASYQLALRETDVRWPLEELCVTGDLLGPAETLEAGTVVLILDVPADELPWLARHPAGEWVGEQLRLRKRPFAWNYRPLSRPPWNHEYRRLLRFWSARGGLDQAAMDALRSRCFDDVTITDPSPAELTEQLGDELTVSLWHLRHVLESYWDRSWRREHSRFDESPEDHLWRAATAVSDMQHALDELTGNGPTR